MKRYFHTRLHLYYPAGVELLQCNHTQSASDVQPYYRRRLFK
jgi:hypothetical protein